MREVSVLPTAGLLCLKTAKSGGESSWSSSVAVHNELLRLGRADLVEALSGPWCAGALEPCQMRCGCSCRVAICSTVVLTLPWRVAQCHVRNCLICAVCCACP